MATSSRAKSDKLFLFVSLTLVVLGFSIFSSAALGLLARESSNYSSVAFSQTVLGLCLGFVALVAASNINFKIWRKLAFYILILAIVLNLLIFIPGLGVTHGGATRWLSVAGVSFQPSELLKFAFIIYFAGWCASVKDKVKTFKFGLAPLLVLYGIVGFLLMLQPDTDTYFIIVISGIAILMAAGGRWKHFFVLIVLGICMLGVIAFAKPHVMRRITTFFNPQVNALDASYQVRQSLIAIGSGGVFGRGFGQSVQKFTYLPEATGDSIFAVVGEEFGFVGSVVLLGLFATFTIRGLKIASRVPDVFGRLTIVGIVIMIISQSFVNMGAMLGVVPLSGITLPFVSQGGTSLFATLFEVGVILSISKAQKT
jgi:cell division protein FtsW